MRVAVGVKVRVGVSVGAAVFMRVAVAVGVAVAVDVWVAVGRAPLFDPVAVAIGAPRIAVTLESLAAASVGFGRSSWMISAKILSRTGGSARWSVINPYLASSAECSETGRNSSSGALLPTM